MLSLRQIVGTIITPEERRRRTRGGVVDDENNENERLRIAMEGQHQRRTQHLFTTLRQYHTYHTREKREESALALYPTIHIIQQPASKP